MIKIYGLIGKTLTHSFSKKYFEHKFLNEKIENCEYQLFEIENINEIYKLLQNDKILGLNVTFPYKNEVLPFCDIIDEAVLNIGAANVLYKNNGKIEAYNTDYIGFEQSLIPWINKTTKKALVLGNGGGAKAVIYTLQKLNIETTIVGRNETIKFSDINEDMIINNNLIIQCTPLGTFPNIEEKPSIPYKFLNASHYLYDLVYNPPLTAFLNEGKIRNCKIKNGNEMLALQAEAAWKIWNNLT